MQSLCQVRRAVMPTSVIVVLPAAIVAEAPPETLAHPSFTLSLSKGRTMSRSSRSPNHPSSHVIGQRHELAKRPGRSAAVRRAERI